MFCLGCGAEVQAGAARCSVCGRELGGAPPAARVAEAAGTAVDTALQSAPSHTPSLGATVVPRPAGSAPGGAPDTPGFPRDVAGRALLITVLAMMLDLLAPWLNAFGTRLSPVQIGTPMLATVAVLGLALTPLARSSLRKRPAAAVLPLIIGAAACGVTAVLWTIQVVVASQLATPNAETNAVVASSPVVGPPSMLVADFGLYLFFFGGGVLVCCGYTMVLEAARTSVPVPAPISHEALVSLVTNVIATMNAREPVNTAAANPEQLTSYGQAGAATRPFAM